MPLLHVILKYLFPSGAEVGLLTCKLMIFSCFTDSFNPNELRLLHFAYWKTLGICPYGFLYQASCFLNYCGVTSRDEIDQVTNLVISSISREEKQK